MLGTRKVRDVELNEWINRRFIVRFRESATVRHLSFAALAIPINLLIAVWKFALFVPTASILILATGVFSVAQAMCKTMAVFSHSVTVTAPLPITVPQWMRTASERQVYRRIAVVLIVGSLLIAASWAPQMFGHGQTVKYTGFIAINLAAITFIQLGITLRGLFAARGDRLVEAIKLTNVIGAVTLLPLTQVALLSYTEGVGHLVINGRFGVGCAVVCAFVGVFMLMRRFPATDTSSGSPDPTAR